MNEVLRLYTLRIFVSVSNNKIDKDKLIKYWIEGSDDDFDTMIAMFKAKRYSWSFYRTFND